MAIYLDFILGVSFLGLMFWALVQYIHHRKRHRSLPQPKAAPKPLVLTPPPSLKGTEATAFFLKYKPVYTNSLSLLEAAKTALASSEVQQINDMYFKSHFSVETLQQLKPLLSQRAGVSSKLWDSLQADQAILEDIARESALVMPKYRSYCANAVINVRAASGKCMVGLKEYMALIDMLSRRIAELETKGLGSSQFQQPIEDGTEGESFVNSQKAIYFTRIMEALEEVDRYLGEASNAMKILNTI
jgi:hypothetical protein